MSKLEGLNRYGSWWSESGVGINLLNLEGMFFLEKNEDV